jgi:hypothetical protein
MMEPSLAETVERHGRSGAAFTVILWVANIFAVIALGVVGWSVAEMATHVQDMNKDIHAIDIRVTAVESNRFTSGDAAKLMERIIALQNHIAGMPKQFPPDWFRERVTRIEDKLDHIERRIDGIEKAVNGGN